MKKKSSITMALAMTIFGTIGIFRRLVPLSSSLISFVRGIVGTIVLLLFAIATKQTLRKSAIRANLVKLIVSGALIGLNWIFLFEAYNYTTVAIATVCYYMAPVFVMIASPFIFKEKLSVKRICIVLCALVGMMFVSGVISPDSSKGTTGPLGIIFGLLAAVLYAIVVIINKTVSDINAYEKTITQLGSAAIVLLPYVLLTEDLGSLAVTPAIIGILLVMGIVHTGLAYFMYFGSMDGMSPVSIALYSYIDPVVAIILSAVLLKESITIIQIVGAVLILGSTLFGEISNDK